MGARRQVLVVAAPLAMVLAGFVLAVPSGCVLVTGSTEGYVLDAGACDGQGTPIPIEDAGLPGDSGATTTGCYACIQQACGAQVTACSADCACRDAISEFLACLRAESPIVCGAKVQPTGGDAFTALSSCVLGQSNCSTSACGGAESP